MNAAHLKTVLGGFRYDLTSEDSIQLGIEQALHVAGVKFDREARLSVSSRLDFLVGGIAVEVKLKGGRHELLRQLSRYSQFEVVRELLVVTGRLQLSDLPDEIGGKPLDCLVLIGSVF